MAEVGFSTGCLYRSSIPFRDKISLYSALGTTVIELGFATPAELADFEISAEVIRYLREYNSIFVHAPWRDVRYGSNSKTDGVVERLQYICSRLQIKGIVMHPTTIDKFAQLENVGLPFLLENMNSEKHFGIKPEHIRRLRDDYNFGFVFDVQHAYEHDPNMVLAYEILDAMGQRLHHMHVSGCTDTKNHSPTYISTNKDAIAKVLTLGLNVPKILEGILLESINETASQELAFVRAFERK